MTPQEKQDRAAMKRELARLLAQMCAEDGDENVLETFTNVDIPILPASVVMEVRVRMIHKTCDVYPKFDFAGVLGVPV